jgi:mRNA interferase MazF
MESTETPRRGQIWLTSFGSARRGEPEKNRPALLVSDDDLLSGGEEELIIVVPLSSSRSPSALRPNIPATSGISRASAALPRAVRSIPRRRLLRPLGEIDAATLPQVERALLTVLGLDKPN